MLKNSLECHKIQHILLNRIPIQNKAPTYATLQNLGDGVFVPQSIFNEGEFLAFFTTLGFELVARWEDSHDSCIIPFHRDISVQKYSGFYFRRESSESPR